MNGYENRHRDSNSVAELEKNESVDIIENDRIEVVDPGRGELRFTDGLVVELIDKVDLHIDNVRLDAGDSVFVRFKQAAGHTRTELRDKANARVSFETAFATVSSDKEGTEFIICQNPRH